METKSLAFVMFAYETHRERLAGADMAVRAVWHELNMRAVHKPDTARAPDGRPVALARGQWLTNVAALAQILRTTGKVIRRCLAELERRGLIKLATSRLDGTLVTVVGYGADRIGQSDGQSDGQSVSDGKPAPVAPSKADGKTDGQSKGQTDGQPLEELEEPGRGEEISAPPQRADARPRVLEDDPFPVLDEDGLASDGLRAAIERRAGCRRTAADFDRDAWAGEFRQLRRERDLSHEEIGAVLSAALRRDHWSRRIRSAAMVRTHWVEIALDARNPRPEPRGKPKLRTIEGGYGRDVGAH
jgi:hypothetical protein